MKVVQQTERVINGFAVRTNNRAEMDPNTGKIGPLWQQLFTDSGLSPMGLSPMDSQPKYGVYFEYQSDMDGDFTVLAGIEGSLDKASQNVTLAAGSYLVFSASGTMPQPVIDAWGEIWRYFSAEDCPYKRCYQTDYEIYVSPNQVDVYIGVQG
jgi:predicted transcriptional regulator YdeE